MRTLLVVFLSMFAVIVTAEEKPNLFSPDQIRIAKVTIQDRATNGCWTNLKESREYFEEQFRLNGYEIIPEEYHKVPKAEQERVSDVVLNLGSETPMHVIKSAYMTMIQDNRYDAKLRVYAARTGIGQCVGTMTASIQRYIIGHHEDAVSQVNVESLEQAFSDGDNLNIPVLDLAKTFVKYFLLLDNL